MLDEAMIRREFGHDFLFDRNINGVRHIVYLTPTHHLSVYVVHPGRKVERKMIHRNALFEFLNGGK